MEELDEFCLSLASSYASFRSSSARRFSNMAQLGHAGLDAASLMLHSIGSFSLKNKKRLNGYEIKNYKMTVADSAIQFFILFDSIQVFNSVSV